MRGGWYRHDIARSRVTEPEPDRSRPEDGGQPLRVSTLELFFDLVFVFTITQLTALLAHDVTVADGSGCCWCSACCGGCTAATPG